MTQKNKLIFNCIIIYILIFSCTYQKQIKAISSKPNILFILSDDQAWDDYHFMGNKQLNTPYLDQLANQSLLFKNGYVVAPICRPSLASIVTGLYPSQHGIIANDVDLKAKKNRKKLEKLGIDRFNKFPSIIKGLNNAGYATLQTGKWWEGSWKEGHFSDGMTKGNRAGDAGLTIGRKGIKKITSFIDKNRKEKKPFFIWYAPLLPHTPHNPPKRLLKKYAKQGRPTNEAKYFAMIEWFDESCGKLINYLDEKKLRENTLIIYICDNGWKPANRWARKTKWEKYALKSKGTPYQNGIRTPIMFSWRGKIQPLDAPELASSIDLLPTIFSIIGLKTPKGLDGINLLDKKTRQQRKTIYGQTYTTHNMTYGDTKTTLQYAWMIEQNYKYIKRFYGEDKTQFKTLHSWDKTNHLYNLKNDPYEKENLIDKYPKVVSKLDKKVKQFLKQNPYIKE